MIRTDAEGRDKPGPLQHRSKRSETSSSFGQTKLLCRTPHGEERQIVCLFETFAEAAQIV
jgi:hypothetical protein